MIQATRRGKGGRPALLLAGVLALAAVVAVAVLVASGRSAEASFPGKNGKIAFMGTQGGDYEIYKMNPDGSGLKQLTNNTKEDFDPSWSPDGSKVAFWRAQANGMNEIFVKNTTNGQLVQLTDSNDSMSDVSPSWSSDGSKIVFVSFGLVCCSRDIWVMNSDGSGRKRLTTNSLSEGTVAWSPDGSKIAFDTQTNECDIWVMNSDGTNLQNLTNTSDPLILEGHPSWSPDGSKIAFDRFLFREGGQDLWVMNADGTGKKNLTNTPAPSDVTEYNPSWSPNGRKIAYVWDNSQTGDPTLSTDLWVMNADGTSPRNITNTSWHEFSPDWQPIPQTTP